MRLAIISKTGDIYPVADDVEQYDLDKPLARGELILKLRQAISEVPGAPIENEYVRLVPVMEWLAGADEAVKLSFLDSFGTRDTGYVPDLDTTTTDREDMLLEGTEVRMLELVHDHWFDEAVIAWNSRDDDGLHLWVRADLVG